MTATTYSRGWPIEYNQGNWIYSDTGEKCFGDDRRPCARCGRDPTPDRHDACVGHLDGVAAACCGHGTMEPWITTNEQLGIKENNT